MISLEEIYDATNNGLDIIRYYYPQARPGRNFAVRPDDRHPSAAVKLLNGCWRLTDFGDEGRTLRPIDIAMEQERLPFRDTVDLLAERYGLASPAPRRVTSEPTSEPDGITDVTCVPLTERDARFFFGGRITNAQGAERLTRMLADYGWCRIGSYARCKAGRKTTITSSEDSPVYRRTCRVDGEEQFYKYYQPREKVRFFYDGRKPADYINGLEFLPEDKVDAVVICSGERDSMVCRALGQHPVWFNSETARPSVRALAALAKRAKEVYIVPDTDPTGVRAGKSLSLEWNDFRTVILPLEKGTGKDLRDWAEENGTPAAFGAMLNAAPRCRFWNDRGKDGLAVNSVNFLHFLSCLGFARTLDGASGEEVLVQVTNNVITRMPAQEIRAAVTEYLRRHNCPHDIMNLYLNSPRCGTAALSDLPTLRPDTVLSTEDAQSFVFCDTIVTVTADGITSRPLKDTPKHVFADTVIPHRFRKIEPAFRFDKDGLVYPTRTDSNFFRYLIQTSRLYWRKERGTDAERSAVIDGTALSAEEAAAQRLNLSGKMYCIGYLLHATKAANRPWAVWAMENNVGSESESYGGSGKSFLFATLATLAPTLTLNGSERDLTGDRALFDRYNESTRIIQVDDASANLDLRYFYPMITGDMIIKKKYMQSACVPFARSPKLVFSSNFPPANLDPSTRRRFIFLLFSDYYHQRTAGSDYLETRSIADDFGGRQICSAGYPDDDWNKDYNFLLECLQYYLAQAQVGRKIEPLLDGLENRIANRVMGESFAAWADDYFAQEGDKLDRLIPKREVYNDFLADTAMKWSIHRFTKALRAFADVCPHIAEMNPATETGYHNGRIVRIVDGRSVEYIYMRTGKFRKEEDRELPV